MRTEVPHVLLGMGPIPMHLLRSMLSAMPSNVVVFEEMPTLDQFGPPPCIEEMVIKLKAEAEAEAAMPFFPKETAHERAHRNEPFYARFYRKRKRQRKHKA